MALWRTAALCILWVLQCAVCREVTLPSGPLYRVAGFPLSLPCAVSGYEGSRTQDFEWFLYRDDSGGQQMGVVSTRDPSFAYTPFQARVRAGEVRVEREAGDRARLLVQRLRPEDQGRYECYTPSTDSKYQGNYSASVVVKVMPDTLQISYSRSLAGQPLPEGAELQLTCSAGIQSQQHTHLSVTFGMRSGRGVREIMAMDKELGVNPGGGGSYRRRYEGGEMTLEKRSGEAGKDLYVMTLSAVAPEDSGMYFCEASQWILDPGSGWEKIAQRTLDIGNLTVQPLADSLTVTSSPRGPVTLQPGSPLSLTCQVGGLPTGARSGLLVQWTRRGPSAGEEEVPVVRMVPNGAVSWGAAAGRGGAGSMEKESEGRYSLRLFSAHPADAGVYRCTVSVFAGRRLPGPAATATITRQSDDVMVSFKTKEVLVSAEAWLPRGPLLKRGSTIALLCNVSVVTTGPTLVEVAWLRRPLEEAGATPGGGRSGEQVPPPSAEGEATLLASRSYDGVTRVHGNGSEASVERVAAGSYRLRIHGAGPEDQGRYACQARVWGQDPRGGWYDTGARARSASVRVYLYARVEDLLLIPLIIGVSSALFVGIFIVATVTCCFMKRLAKQRSRK